MVVFEVPPLMPLPNYAHLLVEARQRLRKGQPFVTVPTALYVDLLQRAVAPGAPLIDEPYEPPGLPDQIFQRIREKYKR